MRHFYLIVAAMLLAANTSCAADVDSSKSKSETTSSHSADSALSNIGFMKNPPKQLTERFPMCDAFLDVEWIDKEKKIGYSHYEVFSKGEKKLIWALVNLNSPIPRIDYDIYQYKRQGRLEEVFESVRKGEVRVGIPMMINYKGEDFVLFPGKSLNNNALHPLLSNHQKSVCVPYPEEKRVWIIEGKNVGQTYTKGKIDNLVNEVRESTGKQVTRSRVESLWILDVNFDGIKDFVLDAFFVYFESGKLHAFNSSFEYPNFIFVAPTSGKSCLLSQLNGYLLTTDGKNFYFNNTCNLTELIGRAGEE